MLGAEYCIVYLRFRANVSRQGN